jgi:hypothetical protein
MIMMMSCILSNNKFSSSKSTSKEETAIERSTKYSRDTVASPRGDLTMFAYKLSLVVERVSFLSLSVSPN